jgi:bifunctional UDP-N-acetylglucosamine pyrophosphorylase/glucosamine-1-phosphate N-acetyltransferase
MTESIGLVILAAGKGTRMKIETPKALARTAGRALLDYVVDGALTFVAASGLAAEVGLVVGHRKELVEDWLAAHPQRSRLRTAWQREQKGTADALRACFADLPHFWDFDYTLVACADTPLIRAAEFETLFAALRANPALVGVAATFEARDPKGYGRIVRGAPGFRIVEEKDATDAERRLTEVNSGFYILRTRHVREVLGTIGNENNSGEFYLTDLFQERFAVAPVKFPSETPFLGINTLEQLAEVTGLLRDRKLRELMLAGVEFLNPATVHVDDGVHVGVGAVIYPNVTLLGGTVIGERVVVESGAFIRDSEVRAGSEILAHSYLEGALVHEDVTVGPMARLRPGADVGPESKIGNFVEVKMSKLAKGVKVSHLSYVGDAEIGENTNIGCGFITCNYDGVNKHKTRIGRNTFIGSDCQLVAPIEIGDDVFVAAGSTITKDVPAGAFGIARAPQVTKDGAARRFLKTKKS